MAATNDAPKVSRYAARARSLHTALQKSPTDSEAAFMKQAEIGSKTRRLR